MGDSRTVFQCRGKASPKEKKDSRNLKRTNVAPGKNPYAQVKTPSGGAGRSQGGNAWKRSYCASRGQGREENNKTGREITGQRDDSAISFYDWKENPTPDLKSSTAHQRSLGLEARAVSSAKETKEGCEPDNASTKGEHFLINIRIGGGPFIAFFVREDKVIKN